VPHREVGAFGFWDFKIPKAFRRPLFERYPLTGKDSIYSFIGMFDCFRKIWVRGDRLLGKFGLGAIDFKFDKIRYLENI
jgi:hypothetical protein